MILRVEHCLRHEKVHVGRDQWIPRKKWVYAFGMTKPKQFVRYLALHLYGPETLKKSTISGKPSNRSKKRGTIDGDKEGSEEGCKEEIKLPETLDPEKLEAIRDSTRFFLRSKKFKEWSATTKESHIESINTYLTTYISDLKKKPRKDKPQDQSKNKRKSSEKVAVLLKKKKKTEENVLIHSEQDKELEDESGGHSGEELENFRISNSKKQNEQDQRVDKNRLMRKQRKQDNAHEDVFDEKIDESEEKQRESKNDSEGEEKQSESENDSGGEKDDVKETESDEENEFDLEKGNKSISSIMSTEPEEDMELNNISNESFDEFVGAIVPR
ncbi:hypothetical protein QAD02_014652 [Eretmocerus hayati]|uniref:Uncharacterized protein n=1 Tax=Eretmocerus hayati TaxID=131215 RepID=A0ACC2P5L5_9HYME|nr:hypothetical protein QAD02_014652 [Eretmocerus hayati]